MITTADRDKVLDDFLEIFDLELDARKSLLESSAMGYPLSECSRGEIMGLFYAKKKHIELRTFVSPHPNQLSAHKIRRQP